MQLRHQLAAYSPIPVSANIAAAACGFRLGDDVRPRLTELLDLEYRSRRTLLCGSGTQALEIAIRLALRSSRPDASIALPAYSCYDVATAAVACNAPIRLYDLNPDTLSPDQHSLETVLSRGARVVVIAPLYGMPVPWHSLEALAERHDAILIEDAAQGHGATWRAKPLGSLGAISTLSFGRGKGWTGGGGGAVLTRDGAEEFLGALPQPHLPAEARAVLGLVAQWGLGRPSLYGIPRSVPSLGLGETTYHAPSRPRSMTRAAAAAVIHSHDMSLHEAAQRRVNAERILAAVDKSVVKPIRLENESIPGYLRLAVRVRGGLDGLASRDDALALGMASGYPTILAELPAVVSRMSGPQPSWPGAETLARDLVTIPTHSRLSRQDLNEICRMVGSRA